jgi:hypothetical protein
MIALAIMAATTAFVLPDAMPEDRRDQDSLQPSSKAPVNPW